MRNQNFYYKIPNRKNFTERLDGNQKYSSRIRTKNLTKLSSNYNSLENETSDCTSFNRINYSYNNELNPINNNHKIQYKSNIISNHKLTYVLTTNESSHFEEKNKREDLLKTQDFGEKKEKYEKKYLECFQSYTENKKKRSFSNKLKKHRENLNNIVKLLNEANNTINNKNKNDINDSNENDIKENIKNCKNNNLNNDLFINNIESQKLLTDSNNRNKNLQLRDKFNANTYSYNKQKNNYISNPKARDINHNLNKKLNNPNLENDKIINHTNLTNDKLRELDNEKRNNQKDESVDEYNII